MPDDVKSSVSDPSGGENLDPSKSGEHATDGDKSGKKAGEGDTREQPIPYPRFKEVNEKYQEAQEIVDWYRDNIGDPDDVLAFRSWKAEQVKAAEKAKEKGKISPERLEQVRELMKMAFPQIDQVTAKQEKDEEARFEGQLDDAAERIRELCEDHDLPQDDKISGRIGLHILDEIRSDKKLAGMWNRGNLKCVDIAFKRYVEDFLGHFRKGGKNGKGDTKDVAGLRKISRLPSIPHGGETRTFEPPKRKEGDKGITKQAHEDAWAILQSHMTEQREVKLLWVKHYPLSMRP